MLKPNAAFLIYRFIEFCKYHTLISIASALLKKHLTQPWKKVSFFWVGEKKLLVFLIWLSQAYLHTPIYLKVFAFALKVHFLLKSVRLPPQSYYFDQYVLLFSETFRRNHMIKWISSLWNCNCVLYHISYSMFWHSALALLEGYLHYCLWE